MTYGINYSNLPPHMHGAIQRYIDNGIEPGSFLKAVLSNDLVQAFGAADEFNSAAMRDWAMFLYNEAPSGCWGSREKVHNWIKQGGIEGMNKSMEQDNE